ncbi:MAG: hypothetical protein KAJ07_13260 [Planctomycetes bacterium]|nr:hypothetical protein [Planctomycetota bacterium]
MDNINNDLVGSGLVRSLPRLIDGAGEDRSRRQGEDARGRVSDDRSSAKERFTVKVSRRVNNARERLTRRFGMYGAQHVFPLGMYVNYLA